MRSPLVSPPTDTGRADLARAHQLVTPAWLSAQLRQRLADTQRPLTRPWRLLEVGYGQHGDFLAAHIPTAQYLDTNSLEDGPFWNKVADAALLALLLGLGIKHDTTVVVYGRSSAAAARVAHLLLYAGVDDGRLFDSGKDAWRRAGGQCEAGSGQVPTAPATFGRRFPACPRLLIDRHKAAARLVQPDGALVSIRTWDEFTGQTSGYPYIAAAGDVPGARWGRAGDGRDVNSMSDFHYPDGTMRPEREIARFWQQSGITPDRNIAFYCGTGWRASLAFFYAWLMGWERISVYDGGWFEWSAFAAPTVDQG